jgi:hypothetical protein
MIYYELDQYRSAVLYQFSFVFVRPLVLISAGRLFIVVAVPPGELLTVPLQRLLVQLILKVPFANRLRSHKRGHIILVVDTTLFDDERTNQTVFRRFSKTAKSHYELRHVCPYVRLSAWNNSAPTGRIFMKIDTSEFFETLSRKLQFCLNLTRITGTLHEDLHTLVILSRSVPLRMKNISDKSCREKCVFNYQ